LGRRCQSPTGGFGGGPGQLPHLAPTYASVLSLCIINTEESLNIIDREKLREFIISLKDPNSKGFRMHKDGEVDIRGSYTALTVAKLLNIFDDEVTAGVAEHVLDCQTYEGGIGSNLGNEAHGGYAFCGLAAMTLLKKSHELHLESLAQWCTHRQMNFEGGFQGRTNKLVDACYSFWMGATIPLLHATLSYVDSREQNEEIYKHLQWTVRICLIRSNTSSHLLDTNIQKELTPHRFIMQSGNVLKVKSNSQHQHVLLKKSGLKMIQIIQNYSESGILMKQHYKSTCYYVVNHQQEG
jgi:prenyltransferase beta subunit